MKNKNQGLVLFIILAFLACLFPVNAKADGEIYDVSFKFFRIPKNADGTISATAENWFWDTYVDGGNGGPEELIGDNITVNPGDYIAVAPVVKTLGTPSAKAITLYYSFDNTVFDSFSGNADYSYVHTETANNGGCFPGNRTTKWIAASTEINTNLSRGSMQVEDGGGTVVTPFDNTEDIPIGIHIYKVKDTVSPGKIINFNYLFIVDQMNPAESQIVDSNDLVIPTTYNNSSLLKVYGEAASPSTLSGIEITHPEVDTPFPLNNPFDSSVTNYDVVVPNKASSVNIKLSISDPNTVINSTSGTLTKSADNTYYTLSVPNLAATVSEETINTITFMVIDPTTGDTPATPKTYTLNITRIDADTSFTLSLEGIDDSAITYDAASKTYSVSTPLTHTVVTATPANVEAAITLKEGETVLATTKNPDGSISSEPLVGSGWDLADGINTRTVTVDGANCQEKHQLVPGRTCTTNTYTILITKISNNANLNTLTVTSMDSSNNPTVGTLSPEFSTDDPEGTEYTYTYPEGTTRITLNGTVVAVGKANITSGAETYTLSSSVTSGTIVVTAEDGTTVRRYKVNFVKEISTDSSLRSLTVKNGDDETVTIFPTADNAFAPGTTTYNILLENSVTKVKIEAEKNSSSATISGDTGVFEITGFDTVTKTITVTAEDSTHTDYVINFTRSMSSNANIASVKINDDVIPASAFDASTNTYRYNKSVKGNVNSVSIVPTFEESTASVQSIVGNTALHDGDNEITMITKAQDGTNKTYKIIVNRLSNDTRLSGLTVSSNPAGRLNIDFNENVRTYTYTYKESVNVITVTPTLKAGTTLVSGGGDYDPSTVTEAVITIKAEDDTTNTYTVKFERERSSDATLRSLTVLRKNETESYALTPRFDPAVTEYDLVLPHNIRFVTIVAEATSANVKSISDNGRMENVEIVQFDPTKPVVRQFTVTAEDGTTKTYTIRLSREKSNDASLKTVTINGTTIVTSDFNSNLEYRLDPVKSDVASLDISSWDLSDEYILDTGHIESHGTVRILNNTLVEGQDNTVTLEVTSQDGRVVKNYKILVRRMSSYNKLDDVIFTTTPVGKGFLEGSFDPDTLTYTYKYDRSVNNILVTASVDADTGANIISGNGDYPIPTSTSASIVVGAEDTDVPRKTYTINFEQIIETDNTLKTLSVTSGDTTYALTPEFDPETTTYNVSVPGDVTSVTINAEKNNQYAADPVGTGVKTLNFGGNRFEIKVTSESNETKTYVVNINRPVSTNAKLSDLTIDGVGGATITGFDPDLGTYQLVVDYSRDKINIQGTKAVDTSTISGDTGERSLNVGDNNFQVVVTAEDGTTKGYYNINVRRKSNDSSLRGLASSVGEVTVTGVNSYRVDVPSGINTINLIPTTNHPNATIANPNVLNNISVLTSSVSFDVLAEDPNDSYKSTYTVTINIVRKSNNYLSTLTTDLGTFDTPFVKTNNDYVITVESDTTKVLLNATTEDASATIKDGDLGEKTLNYGDNYYTITVIAEDGARNVYNVNIYRPYKDIVSLSYLNFNGSLIEGFTNEKTSYTITVPFNTSEITLAAQALDHPDAIASGNDLRTHDFTSDRETYSFIVTSHRGTVQAYTVTVIRGVNPDVNLTSLAVENYDFDKDFESRTSTYSIGDVLDNVNSLTVLAQTTNPDATIKYRLDENEEASDNVITLDDSVSLGNHTIIVIVRVEDNVNTYYINFTRIQSGLSVITSDKKEDGVTDIHAIDDLYIKNARPQFLASDFKNEFLNEYTELHIYSNGTEIADGDIIATGMTMKLERNGAVLDQKDIVILGEVTGDGLIEVSDAFRVIQHALGNDPLEGALLKAAETTGDGAVEVSDAFRVIQHALGNDPFEW